MLKICLLHFFLHMILLIFKPFLSSINLLCDRTKVFIISLQCLFIMKQFDFKNFNLQKNYFVADQIMMSDFVIKVVANFIVQITQNQFADFDLVIDLHHHQINFPKYLKFNCSFKCFKLFMFVHQIKIIYFINLYFQIKIQQSQVKLSPQIKSYFMLKVKHQKAFQKVRYQKHYQVEIQLLDLFIEFKHHQISYFNRLIPIYSHFTEGRINLLINQN